MKLDQLGSWTRTHKCLEVSTEDVGKDCLLMGWVNSRRDHGGVIFIDLRDYTGISQIVFSEPDGKEAFEMAEQVRSEYVLAVKGRLRLRSEDTINLKMRTGKVELVVHELKILNNCAALPFQISDDSIEVNEKNRLRYRTLDLRRPRMQSIMMLRSRASQIVRNFFYENNFFEIETPVLTKSTPEGARDYLVPSRLKTGGFFALPQSPQLFKQMLMISGYDRYFQIVKCFRDEDLRGNRQPEFTQIDLEMSFVDQRDVISLVERMVAELFMKTISHKIELPIRQMKYDEAMSLYGSDAPDLRFGLTLVDLTAETASVDFKVFADAVSKGGIVKSIMVPGGASFSRKELDDFTEFVKIYKAKGMAWVKLNADGWQSPIAKFFTDDQMRIINEKTQAKIGDLILFAADRASIVHDSLGNLRKEIARKLNLIDEKEFKFVWVTDFPLLEYNDEEKTYHPSHHPFTMPVIEHLDEWGEKEPGKIKALAYDLVLNGVELGGGSIRIHTKDIQERVFKLLKLTTEEVQSKFGFF
ncbi:MAG: aspartate--tRNA ligase, partial [Deltaproteobacteria bacterium]|nr:aspartate--tRNA ligase [Deltaproteobacteria bacterium]